MAFQRQDIQHLGKLAKFILTEEEVDHFQHEMNRIVEMVKKLDELNVSAVEPLYQVSGECNRTDADVLQESVFVQDIRGQFPEETADHHIGVHAVFNDDTEK